MNGSMLNIRNRNECDRIWVNDVMVAYVQAVPAGAGIACIGIKI